MTSAGEPDAVRLTLVAGSVELVATCAPGQEPLARDVLDTLARLERLRPGLRVRFGWSLLTLREDAPGTLTVCEPDFTGDARHELRPRIDTTLDVLHQQVALARRIGAPPAEVAFDEDVIVRRGALDGARVELFREEPSEGDSGWRVLSVDMPEGTDADFEVVPVFALLRTRPVILTVLALPTGYGVQIVADRITRVFDQDGRDRLVQGSK